MDAFVELTNMLQIAGGWGLSAILMGVIWRLWGHVQAKDDRIFRLLDKQNEILKALERLERER